LLSQEIQRECVDIHDVEILQCLKGTASEKADTILDVIYNNDRTWHNWLYLELKFRVIANDLITLGHGYEECANSIGISSTPEKSHFVYLKFNSLRGGSALDHKSFNAGQYDLVIDGDELYTEELNRGIYNKMISQFNLTDNYAQASRVHARWYQLHKKSEREIVQDLAKLYNITEL